MIKKEWKNLLNNKILLIVVAAIIMIPFLYAGLFLKSMWDPYGNLDKLPVAVVNEDRSASYGQTTLHIGQDLTDALKENDALDFYFTDRKTADNGLASGTYYMVITIPEDFSANAATLLDENPQKITLQYATNPGTNYIASKMSETALAKIQDEIASQVTETYVEVVFDGISEAGDGMQKAATGSKKIQKGIQSAQDGNQTVTDNLKLLSDSSLIFSNGTQTLAKGLQEYTDGVSQIHTGAIQLDTGTKSLVQKLPQLLTGLETLQNGIHSYVSGVNTLSDSVIQYTNGTKQLADGTAQLYSQLSSLSGGIAEEQLQSLASGMASVRSCLEKAGSDLSDNTGTLKQTSEQIVKISEQTADSAAYISEAGSQISEASKLLSDGKNSSVKLLDQCSEDASQKIQTANDQITASKNAMQSTASALTSIRSQLAQDETVSEETLSALDESIAKLQTSASECTEVSGIDADAYTGQMEEATASSTSELDRIQSSLEGTSGQLSQISNTVSSSADTFADAADDLKQQSSQMSQDAMMIKSIAENIPDIPSDLLQNVTASVGSLCNGFDLLTANNETLNEGAQNLKAAGPVLKAGVNQLADGADPLSDGTSRLSDGTSALCEGTKTLVFNNNTLNSGASELYDGAIQIQDGAFRLYSGSSQLTDGMKELSEGSKSLTKNLKEGAKSLKSSQASEDTVDMFASPVSSKESKLTNVENNGHAMAPYMMSVGLWVGCLAFCLMYPLTKYKGSLTSGPAWWAGKASVLYGVAILQGIFLILLLHVIDGFTPAQITKTVLFSCLSAVAFTSIMYFFNITLGKIGSFLMLIFMVIQLSGSAGTYPVEISPSFVSKIHDYLPFTYTVNAFRSTICGGESIRTSVIVLVVLTIVFTALTILQFCRMARRRKNGQPLLIDWLEEKGLA